LKHLIYFLDSSPIHPAFVMSEAAAEAGWNVEEFMDKRLLLFLLTE